MYILIVTDPGNQNIFYFDDQEEAEEWITNHVDDSSGYWLYEATEIKSHTNN